MLIATVRFIPFFHFHPIFWLVSLFLYFLPAFLARNKPDFISILLLNILAGWTLIGWIIALIWALTSARLADNPARPARVFAARAGPPSQPRSAECAFFGEVRSWPGRPNSLRKYLKRCRRHSYYIKPVTKPTLRPFHRFTPGHQIKGSLV